jgi:hypothetical protein
MVKLTEEMTEPLAHGLRIDAGGEQVRGMSMAEVVQADARNAGLGHEPIERLPH